MFKIIIITAVACALGYCAYHTFDTVFAPDEYGQGTDITACTAEAKLCPDGSAVGRAGPNCEFAACPNQ